MRISDWSSDVCSFRSAFSPRPLRHAQGVSSKRIATFLKGRFPHRHQTVQTGEGTDERQTLPLRHQAHPEHARTAARRQPGAVGPGGVADAPSKRSEEQTSELQDLKRIWYADLCVK